MASAPKISICIPVYNTAPYLAKCLDSVIGQTFQDIEIIIVNDASTDDSQNIIREYAKKDSRIHTIVKTQNEGQGVARHDALKRAKGEYVGFVDSDDWIASTFFETLLDEALRNDSDVVICGYYKVYELRKKSIQHFVNEWDTKSLTLQARHGKIFPNNINPAFWNKLWKRNLFSGEGILFPNVFMAEDLAVTSKLFYYAKNISHINKALYHYRIVQKKEYPLKHLENVVSVFEGLKKFYEKRNVLDIYINDLNRLYAGNIRFQFMLIAHSTKRYHFRFLIEALQIASKSSLKISSMVTILFYMGYCMIKKSKSLWEKRKGE